MKQKPQEAENMKLTKAISLSRKYSPSQPSHDFSHALRVMSKALLALSIDRATYSHIDDDFIIDVSCACLIHDCLDHKFVHDPDEYAEIKASLVTELGEEMVAVSISTSWSKRTLNLVDSHSRTRSRLIARYVQNADWWDAIDLERAVQYSKETGLVGEELREDVISHCREKLVLIHSELSDTFQKLAQNDHKKLMEDLERF